MQQQQQEAIMQQALLQQQQQHMYHPGVLAAAMSQVPSSLLSFFLDMGCAFYVCLLLLITKLDDLSYWASLSFIHTWI